MMNGRAFCRKPGEPPLRYLTDFDIPVESFALQVEFFTPTRLQ
jgi:hypothetical protein